MCLPLRHHSSTRLELRPIHAISTEMWASGCYVLQEQAARGEALPSTLLIQVKHEIIRLDERDEEEDDGIVKGTGSRTRQ